MKTFLGAFVLVAFIGLLILGCSDKSISPVESTANNNPVTLQKDTGPELGLLNSKVILHMLGMMKMLDYYLY